MPTELGLARVLDIVKRRKSGKPDLRYQARHDEATKLVVL